MSRFEGTPISDAQLKIRKLVEGDLNLLESRVVNIADPRYRALCLTELEKVGILIFQGIAKGGVLDA